MPLLEADYCEKESFAWTTIPPRKDVGATWENKEAVQPTRDFDWPRKARDRYEIHRRVQRVYQWHRKQQRKSSGPQISERFRKTFVALADEWYRDAQFLSVASKAVSHPSYFEIVALGPRVIPLILEQLRDRPSHWFVALRALAKVDPAEEGADRSASRDAWLEWGRKRGYIE
jgi:hypothetical protein